MKSITLAFFCSLNILAFAQNKHIQFLQNTPWENVVSIAQKEQKMIMLDCYTTWCGPCQKMSRNIFTNDSVADYFNQNFINAKFDMENGEGIELAKKFQIMAYPSFLYFDSQGNLIHKRLGYMNEKEFITEGKNAQNPESQLYTLKTLYEKRKKNNAFQDNTTDFLYKLTEVASNANDLQTNEFAEAYLAKFDETQLNTTANQKFIKEYIYDADSRGFISMMKNVAEYYKVFPKSEIDAKIEEVLAEKATTLAKQNPENGETLLTEYCKKISPNDYKKWNDKAIIAYYSSAKNWDKYAQSVIFYIQQYQITSSEVLNSFGWRFFQKVENKTYLAEAVKFVQTGINNKSNYGILDTYAWLLYKMGNYKAAKTAANNAISAAKNENEDYAETEKILEKIKAKKSKK